MNGRVDALEAENAELKTDNADLRAEKVIYDNKVDSLETKVEALQLTRAAVSSRNLFREFFFACHTTSVFQATVEPVALASSCRVCHCFSSLLPFPKIESQSLLQVAAESITSSAVCYLSKKN